MGLEIVQANLRFRIDELQANLALRPPPGTRARLLFDLSADQHLLGIACLLADADVETFHRCLVQSGRARKELLELAAAERWPPDRLTASSQLFPLLGTFIAGEHELAEQIVRLTPDVWVEGEEYEDDFHYARALQTLIRWRGRPPPESTRLVDELEASLGGAETARVPALRALYEADASAFGSSIAQLAQDWAEERDAEAESAITLDERLQTERFVFMEGMALLHLAHHAGIGGTGVWGPFRRIPEAPWPGVSRPRLPHGMIAPPGTWSDGGRLLSTTGPRIGWNHPVRRASRAPDGALAVTGMGMVASIGLSVVDCCAAARARIFRCGPLPGPYLRDSDTGDGERPAGCAVPGLEGFEEAGRLASLAGLAFDDLLANGAALVPGRTGLYVALPSGYLLHHADRLGSEEVQDPSPAELADPDSAASPPTRGQLFRARASRLVVPALLSQVPWLEPSETRLFPEDSPGLASALEAASAALSARALDRAVVGGVDTLVWPDFLDALFRLGLLKGPETPTGILPGEAAAFILVERARAARKRSAVVHAYVESVARAAEPGERFSGGPHHGIALHKAIVSALGAQEDRGRYTGLVIGDLNGTEARATDWGCALARRQPGSSHAEAPLWIPATSFGEVGAATGAVAVCLAARGFARGYAPSANALIWLWAEAGTRAAISVRAPEPEH